MSVITTSALIFCHVNPYSFVCRKFFSAADAVSAQMLIFMQVDGVALIINNHRNNKINDFQKRLGVVTKTIQSAATDLFHFAILFTIVVGGYTVLGFVVFGSAIDEFSSFSKSFESCFQLLIWAI